jgi:hypothetical protein
MPVKAMDFESIASANSARGPGPGIVAETAQEENIAANEKSDEHGWRYRQIAG